MAIKKASTPSGGEGGRGLKKRPVCMMPMPKNKAVCINPACPSKDWQEPSGVPLR